MTVAQYSERPETESYYEELHRGKLVRMSWLTFGDALLRSRLLDPLDAALDGYGMVMPACRFAPFPSTICAPPMSVA